jgi:hypothetical protein
MDVADHRSVQLDEAGRAGHEREKAGMSGAEVVHRELKTQTGVTAHDLREALVVGG